MDKLSGEDEKGVEGVGRSLGLISGEWIEKLKGL
jgi:hypothetical protein